LIVLRLFLDVRPMAADKAFLAKKLRETLLKSKKHLHHVI
jgi:hypothetical protein